MRTWQQRWVDRFYRSRPGWQDGTSIFHDICASIAPEGGRILEIGAGPTNPTSAFLGSLGELDGIDVTDEVLTNRHLAHASVVKNERYPYADDTFDVAVSNYVIEHVEDPGAHLGALHRVLKRGGRYAFRTPNLWHYVALVSRVLPYAGHLRLANRLRDLDEGEHDPWPTVYAMNTPRRVRDSAARSGFVVEKLDMVEKEPSYGMIARPLFAAFMAYERLVNASEAFAPLRSNMFVVLRKV
jgi:SAM-dependent methyltransferase